MIACGRVSVHSYIRDCICCHLDKPWRSEPPEWLQVNWFKPTMSVPLHPSCWSPPHTLSFMSQEEPADERKPWSQGHRTRILPCSWNCSLALLFLFLCAALLSGFCICCIAQWGGLLQAALGQLRILVSLYLHVFSVWHYSQFSEEDSHPFSFLWISPVVRLCSSASEMRIWTNHTLDSSFLSRHGPNDRKQLEYLFK